MMHVVNFYKTNAPAMDILVSSNLRKTCVYDGQSGQSKGTDHIWMI